MKKFGIGIIGLGMGSNVLLINRVPESRLEVRGIYDIDEGKLLYRSTSCGTLNKSSKAPLPKLQCGLFRLYTFSVHLLRWKFMVSRSASSSEDRENPPGRSGCTVPPFHGYGRSWRKDEERDTHSCKDPQIPRSINSLQYLGV
jgi:hypothetical protein